MRKKWFCKGLSVLLAVCVLFTAVTVTAFAEDAGAQDPPKEPVQGEVTEQDKLDAPVLTAQPSDYHTVVLSWGAVPGADGYEVYCNDSLIGSVTGAVTYTYEKAVPYQAAAYRVRAYQNTETGDRLDSADSNEVSVTTELEAPAVRNVTVQTSKKIQFSWDVTDGADGYEMFINGTSIGTTKTASYTYTSGARDVKLTWGKTYRIAVRAYYEKEEYCSEKSSEVSVKMRPAAPKISSAKAASYNSVKVTWTKVAGASGYYIYRKAASGKYKKVGTVNGVKTLTFTDTKAALGISYKYLVRAYWKSGKKTQAGEDSNEKSARAKLNTPQLAAPDYEDSYIQVNWKQVDGAQGYYIYRKLTKKGKYKKIGMVKKGSLLSYTDKTAKKNKVYYYTVKAYRKVDSKLYRSAADMDGRKAALKIRVKVSKVKDKNSILYGKKIRRYINYDGSVIQDVEDIIGKQSSYLLFVNKTRNQVTVYAKDGSIYIPVKAFVCSTGRLAGATPSGTFGTQEKLRWHELMGPCWGQWCTRIHDGVLFHSVYFNASCNNNTLSVSAYNKLGSKASHGCVRLTSGDAKWIYDNCSLGTTVKIYSSSGYEPLKKPTAYKLPSWHTWDPTDPNMQYKCRQKGCHKV